MEFVIVKTKNHNIWRVKIAQYDFKEDWIVFATILGMESPVDFIKHLYANYESSNVAREFYRDEITKACSGISGFDIWFTVKKDAEAFVEELGAKLGGQ